MPFRLGCNWRWSPLGGLTPGQEPPPPPFPHPPWLQAHFTAAANLLSLYNLAVTLGGPAALEELRRERVDRVLGLQGAYDPAWLAAQPLTPLQQ